MNAAPQIESWPDPVPLDDSHIRPDFPVDAFPGWAAEWIRAVSASTQTSPDLAAMILLGVLSSAASHCAEVEVTPDWSEPTHLFTVVVAESGERKSPVFAQASAPLVDWERRRIDSSYPAYREAVMRRTIANKRAEQLLDRAAKAKDAPTRTRLEQEAIAEASRAEGIKVPSLPRLFADDVTPEGLSALLAENAGRLAVMSAEGGFFGTLAGRYSRGIPNLDAVNKAYTGETIRVDRRTSAPLYIKRPALTLGLAVQPDVLRSTRASPEMRERGFLARILYSVPASPVGSRSTDAPSVPEAISQTYWDRVSRLADELIGHQEEPRHLTLSVAAAEEFRVFRGWIEPQLAEQGELRFLRDWGSKLPGAVVRIAGLLHIGHEIVGDEIVGDTMISAIRIGRYLIPHAQIAFGLMSADPIVLAGRRILVELAHRGWSTFTARNLFTALPRGQFSKVGELVAPLELLEDHGHIRRAEEEANLGRGRKPSPSYRVNPRVRAGSAAEYAQITHGRSSAESLMLTRLPVQEAVQGESVAPIAGMGSGREQFEL